MLIDNAWIKRWVAAINADAACQYNGRKFDGAIALQVGEIRCALKIHQGKIEQVVEGATILEPSSFTLSADADVWGKLFAPNPEPMYHALFAAIGMGTMQST